MSLNTEFQDVKKSNKIEIFDSTLRDGAQGEGILFSVEDKIKFKAVCFRKYQKTGRKSF